MSSAHYKTVSTVGQSTTTPGSTSSSSYRVQFGFWPTLLLARDSDRDGIADNWETEYFGDLDTANGDSDYDRDGYTDLQEYLNHLAGKIDPAGGVYDPTASNTPGGTGYIPNHFWTLMLPAIIGASR